MPKPEDRITTKPPQVLPPDDCVKTHKKRRLSFRWSKSGTEPSDEETATNSSSIWICQSKESLSCML